MTVINSNSAALRAQNGTRVANMSLQTAMARLSSGKRINSASDDAAGLAIANSMTSQITGMNQAVRNANDGISLLQTADGALDEVTNMAQRIRELAVQSASGTYSNDDRTNMNAEVSALKDQITAILGGTSFNGKGIFQATISNTGYTTGDAGSIKIQTGSGSGEQTTVDFAALANLDAGATVASDTGATAALTSVDTFLKNVATTRAKLGAGESRLNSVVSNLTNNVTNMTDARSRIQDADFSAETTNLAKAQILAQASTAMLAQANQSQQGVLKLLQ